MIKPEVALDAVSIVIRGHFNAAIFSPLWLFQQNLIGAEAFASANVEVITSDIASFSTGWLNVQVVPDSFTLNATDAGDFERARDAAVGVVNALPHTPVAALGINRQVHFAPRSEEQYQAIGDTLAPKAFWESLVDLPVMRNMVMWGARPDNYGGRVQVQVEPSLRYRGYVYVAHNDHYDLTLVEQRPTTRSEAWSRESEQAAPLQPSSEKIALVTEILTSSWVSSINRSTDIVNAIARIE